MSTTNKLFTVAGVSNLDGEVKVRFANDVMRVKVLTKSGHKDITLIELPEPMTKLDAAKFIQPLDEFQSVAAQSAIGDYLDRNAEKTLRVKADKEPVAAVIAPVITDEADDDKPIGYAELEAELGMAPF